MDKAPSVRHWSSWLSHASFSIELRSFEVGLQPSGRRFVDECVTVASSCYRCGLVLALLFCAVLEKNARFLPWLYFVILLVRIRKKLQVRHCCVPLR